MIISTEDQIKKKVAGTERRNPTKFGNTKVQLKM
jgi:hypothetical protein